MGQPDRQGLHNSGLGYGCGSPEKRLLLLSGQYFEEQLQRIREIRLSGRKFYQKITDIYATSIDQDASVAKALWLTIIPAISWRLFLFAIQFYPK